MNITNRTPSFDFDSWALLARENPQAFESQRRNVIERAISQASPERQKRLRCLQWRLDQIRATTHTPLAACLRMQAMLWDKLAGESGLLVCLQGLTSHPNPRRHTATILPFRH
ncbi:MAG TPA: DUF3135 domain-containing protein [Gammaproteobacteria bacterium]|nr:DUF3135 domain-containing protein [Gammaproteobacteria bacterium]